MVNPRWISQTRRRYSKLTSDSRPSRLHISWARQCRHQGWCPPPHESRNSSTRGCPGLQITSAPYTAIVRSGLKIRPRVNQSLHMCEIFVQSCEHQLRVAKVASDIHYMSLPKATLVSTITGPCWFMALTLTLTLTSFIKMFTYIGVSTTSLFPMSWLYEQLVPLRG